MRDGTPSETGQTTEGGKEGRREVVSHRSLNLKKEVCDFREGRGSSAHGI